MIDNTLNRELYFKYLLYDKNGVYKKQLYQVEDGGTFTYSSLSRLKQSANMTFLDYQDIDFLNDEIQIICVIDGKEYPIARLLITSPKQNKYTLQRSVDCYSRLLILDWDKIEDRYLVSQGTNIINEVKRLIGNAGAYDIENSTSTTIADRIFEIGTPKLDIINILLDSVNYNSLTVNTVGEYISKPYALPTDREIEVTYTDEEEVSIVYQEVLESLDLFNVPNVFIRYTNNPDIEPPLRAIYENNNPASPTSTANRRRIVDSQEVSDIADLETLTLITKKAAMELTTKYSNVEFTTAINPIHDYLNCLYLDFYDIAGKYTETSWEMELKSGGAMRHTARKVYLYNGTKIRNNNTGQSNAHKIRRRRNSIQHNL